MGFEKELLDQTLISLDRLCAYLSVLIITSHLRKVCRVCFQGFTFLPIGLALRRLWVLSVLARSDPVLHRRRTPALREEEGRNPPRLVSPTQNMCFPWPPQQLHIDARLDGTSGPHLQRRNVPWSAHRWHASVLLRNPRGPFDCYGILWSDTVVQHHIPTAEKHGSLLTPSKRTNVLHRWSDRARCPRVCWIDTDTRPRGK